MIVLPVVDALVAEIIDKQIDVLTIDPFVSCHELPENDNTMQDMLVKEWGRVAERGNCAVHLVDHTRKMSGFESEVTTESSRGAKAKTDAARVVRVVNRMSQEEAERTGVQNHRLFFRTYNDKANLAPPADKSDWFELKSVDLDNGPGMEVGGVRFNAPGDSVGVVKRWEWPDPLAGMTGQDFEKVAAVIRRGKWRENAPGQGMGWPCGSGGAGAGCQQQGTSGQDQRDAQGVARRRLPDSGRGARRKPGAEEIHRGEGGRRMILPYLTSRTRTRCRTTPTPKKRGGGTAKRCSTCRPPAGLEVRQVRQRFCDAGQDLSLGACEPAFGLGNLGAVRGLSPENSGRMQADPALGANSWNDDLIGVCAWVLTNWQIAWPTLPAPCVQIVPPPIWICRRRRFTDLWMRGFYLVATPSKGW